MSRAYEQYIKEDDLLENLAIKLSLIIECEFHEGQYCDSGSCFEDVESNIPSLLKSFGVASENQIEITNGLKTIQEAYPSKCSLCVF